MKVFTLGTANRQHFEFTKILGKYGVQVVFDVRNSPASPLAPQFNRDSLQRLCAGQNADYLYLGNGLGEPSGTELRPSSFVHRASHIAHSPEGRGAMGRFAVRRHDDEQAQADRNLREWRSTPEFQRTVTMIAAKAAKRVSCILCGELSPQDCHRFFIAEELVRRGFEVVHILDEAKLWTPPNERRNNLRLAPTNADRGRRPRTKNRGRIEPGANQHPPATHTNPPPQGERE